MKVVVRASCVSMEAFSIRYKSGAVGTRQPQFMSRCSYDMTAPRECLYFCLALLIISSALVSEVQSSSHTRRRSASSKVKTNVEDSTEVAEAVPDQIALAATENQRRKDYGFTNYELNLIRHEQDPRLHAQITAKYSTHIRNTNHHTPSSLEDAETAEEYVSKAMQIYGSRLKEPIRIESIEPEGTSQSNLGVVNEHYNDPSTVDPQIRAEGIHGNQEYIQQHPTQEETKSQLGDRISAQLLEQQENQYQHIHTQEIGEDRNNDAADSNTPLDNPAPVYENGSPIQSYQRFGDENSYEGSQPVDRNYRPKYGYQHEYRSPSGDQTTEGEKIRVSASTEIPKAEIMKQIEKSVMKYMKELEAEGKIVTSPKETKTYYKATPPTEDKRVISTTTRPKYLAAGTTTTYHGAHSTLATSAPHQVSSSGGEKISRYNGQKHHSYKPKATADISSPYQTSSLSHQRDQSDSYGPNVEFVYKIKSRTPLQTATVKTVSKPYSLPLKTSTEHFDHSAALKNMEDFDLSHVVTTNEPEGRSASTNKPSKLYFNSDIHQDINSLPYKSDKSRTVAAEYHRIKEPSGQHPEYKGYPGYFAEPLPADIAKEEQSSADDGYPLLNPYKYILKKEPLPSKYEDTSPPVNWEQPRAPYPAATAQKALEYDSYSPKFNNNPEGYGYQHTFKPEREREPAHIIHKHAQRHAPGKRGKRGGAHHPTSNKKLGSRNQAKDVEANLALRPPPKA